MRITMRSLLLGLCLLLFIPLGCSDDSDNFEGMTQLATPQVSLSQQGNQVQLQWDKVPNAIGYEVEITVDGVRLEPVATTGNLYSIMLVGTSSYRFRVRAIATKGSATHYNSEWCDYLEAQGGAIDPNPTPNPNPQG